MCCLNKRRRRGQALVEFAVVALLLYMLIAAVLTFGQAIYSAIGPASRRFNRPRNQPHAAAGGARHTRSARS